VYRALPTTYATLTPRKISHLKARFIAGSVGSAVAQWLGDASFAEHMNCTGNVRVILRDPRAYLEDIRLDGDTALVYLSLRPGRTYVLNVILKDHRGQTTTDPQIVDATPITIRLGREVHEVDLGLTDDIGTPYDAYFENSAVESWANLLPHLRTPSLRLARAAAFGFPPPVIVEHAPVNVHHEYHNHGQAGVIGPNAQLQDVSIDQTWQQAADTIDVAALAAELDRLVEALRSQATDHDRILSLAAVSGAAQEARAGRGAQALTHLAKATGKWVFDTATTIGTTIVTKLLEQQLGLS
jgi:hypothetical protein